jgi:hypothetical protein
MCIAALVATKLLGTVRPTDVVMKILSTPEQMRYKVGIT